MNYDAITAVEVVEHLHPHELEVFPQNLLQVYAPKVAIVTTPNAEFNVFFPNLMYGSKDSQFRHWDHKFEWTRSEFQDWYYSNKPRAKLNAKLYEYSVTFTGVGLLNSDKSYGHCTQVAVFCRNDLLHLPYTKIMTIYQQTLHILSLKQLSFHYIITKF